MIRPGCRVVGVAGASLAAVNAARLDEEGRYRQTAASRRSGSAAADMPRTPLSSGRRDSWYSITAAVLESGSRITPDRAHP
jgi:hypothetical protein